MLVETKAELKNRLAFYRNLVTKAIKEKKLFRIYGYTHFPKLRAELIKRGYLEYNVISKQSAYHRMSLMKLAEATVGGDEFEKILISKLVGIRNPDFIFVPNPHYYSLYPSMYQINRVRFIGTNYTCKDEMCHTVDYIDKKLKGVFGHKSYFPMPRGFDLTDDYGIEAFEKEYNWTMLTSLITYLNNEKRIDTWFSTRHFGLEKTGLDLAIRYIARRAAAIDEGSTDEIPLTEKQWKLIWETYEGITKTRQRINGASNIAEYYGVKIKEAAITIKRYFPWMGLDGHRNVWLIKPARSAQGEGIFISDDIKRMKRYLKEEDRDFVAQKYVELPFLMHDTKFHLRSYYLIRIDQMEISFYAHPNVQVKIASEPFSFENFDEATHITNISVQKHYENNSSDKLPDNHMMTLERLQEYFYEVGYPNLYAEKIYPSMIKSLQMISEVSVFDFEHKPGRYELLGCDWMIGEDFSTQLIEINRCPSLEHFTPVSTIVLSTIIGDLVKVVVDNYRDAAADTGDFDLIYRTNIEKSVCEDECDSGYSSRKSSVESNFSWSQPAGVNFFEL